MRGVQKDVLTAMRAHNSGGSSPSIAPGAGRHSTRGKKTDSVKPAGRRGRSRRRDTGAGKTGKDDGRRQAGWSRRNFRSCRRAVSPDAGRVNAGRACFGGLSDARTGSALMTGEQDRIPTTRRTRDSRPGNNGQTGRPSRPGGAGAGFSIRLQAAGTTANIAARRYSRVFGRMCRYSRTAISAARSWIPWDVRHAGI